MDLVPRLDCPRCNRQAMTSWQKLWLGPARTRTCHACGAQVSVSGWAIVAMLPTLLAIPASGILFFGYGQTMLATALLLGGFLTMFAGHLWMVPVRAC
jgi:hypothetical protein